MHDRAKEPIDDTLAEAAPAPLCPVDRLPTKRRNQLCIAIIAIGLLNFVVFTLTYAALGGDAHNGHCEFHTQLDGTTFTTYYVRGHFIREPLGYKRQVSAAIWIYSYLHSILVPITSAAMIISMLVLARPHIIATMRDSWISGQTFIVSFGTIVLLVSAVMVFIFAFDFISQLTAYP
ncbi:MAG: hypothetical protein JXO22_06105 [Phycisphaerae bacterium]|nr:hypothetical protein [Phycisphaerae bacterium]